MMIRNDEDIDSITDDLSLMVNLVATITYVLPNSF